MMHPDWLIRSNFRLRRSDNLHKDSHQNSWIYPRVTKAGAALVKTITSFIGKSPILKVSLLRKD